MKNRYQLPAFVFGILFSIISMNPNTASAQYDDVTLETFYEELSPYGVWIDDPQYGKVWRPDVDQDEFRPYYSSGHWEMTQYGNTWVSDYDWGWAPFHYGRWHYAARRGWVWIPGTQWGPAWVSWRSGGGHYGWAPLGPGININISIGRIPDFYWVFVPQRSIYYRSYPRYDRHRNVRIYHNTVIINNTNIYNRNRYYAGPRADEIRRVTRQPVKIHEVRNSRPGRYAGTRDNRPSVRSIERPRSAVQTSRPERSVNHNGSRSTTAPRSGSAVNRQPAQVRRPDQRSTSASSSQRSSRTYDRQEVKRNQPVQRERQQVTQRSQRPEARASRPASSQRTQRAPAPQRQVRQESSSKQSGSQQKRSASSARESSRSQGRPSRAH